MEVTNRLTTHVIVLCLLMATASPSVSGAQQPASATSSDLLSGTLSFLGHSTVGDFVGSTSQVSGAVVGDASGARGWIEAPVATLDTHNEHRDRDLRAVMAVDKYPTMRFDLDSAMTRASGQYLDDTFDVQLYGRLAIHGVTRAIELPAAVSRRGDTLHVSAAFPLDVTDYHIGGLTKLFGLLRMRRQIEVRVDLRFVRATNQANSLTSSTQERIR